MNLIEEMTSFLILAVNQLNLWSMVNTGTRNAVWIMTTDVKYSKNNQQVDGGETFNSRLSITNTTKSSSDTMVNPQCKVIRVLISLTWYSV